jgi:hypothetical protein
MSDALDRILPYSLAFSKAIDRCRSASTSGSSFDAADWEDAYNRLSRLRDRYTHEASNFTSSERKALSKVFEEDTFIEGLLNIRQIGEHVQMREEPVIRLMTNAPITICVETSALGFFQAPIVRVPDTKGQVHSINHLQNLEEAEKRIHRAFTRATNKMP